MIRSAIAYTHNRVAEVEACVAGKLLSIPHWVESSRHSTPSPSSFICSALRASLTASIFPASANRDAMRQTRSIILSYPSALERHASLSRVAPEAGKHFANYIHYEVHFGELMSARLPPRDGGLRAAHRENDGCLRQPPEINTRSLGAHDSRLYKRSAGLCRLRHPVELMRSARGHCPCLCQPPNTGATGRPAHSASPDGVSSRVL